MSIISRIVDYFLKPRGNEALKVTNLPAFLREIGPSPKLLTTDDETRAWFAKNHTCPDCGGEKFYDGPQGGMSVNIKCATEGCDSWFNMCIIHGGYILQFDRIRWTHPNERNKKDLH